MRTAPGTMLLAILLAAPPAWSATPQECEIVPDVVYGHKHGMALTLDVLRPREKLNGAGLLFILSGGWVSAWAPPAQVRAYFNGFLGPLLEEGYSVFLVRHGSSPKYKIPEIIGDVRRSVRYIRHHAKDLRVDAGRLGVFGGSAGGHLTLILATTGDDGDENARDEVLRESSRVAAAMAYMAPSDLRPWVPPPKSLERFPALDFDPKRSAECSPLLQVTPDDAATLLVHGDADRLVPVDHSRKMHAELEKREVACRLEELTGVGHELGPRVQKRLGELMVEWFGKRLAGE